LLLLTLHCCYFQPANTSLAHICMVENGKNSCFWCFSMWELCELKNDDQRVQVGKVCSFTFLHGAHIKMLKTELCLCVHNEIACIHWSSLSNSRSPHIASCRRTPKNCYFCHVWPCECLQSKHSKVKNNNTSWQIFFWRISLSYLMVIMSWKILITNPWAKKTLIFINLNQTF
jgi:hypothetical protein